MKIISTLLILGLISACSTIPTHLVVSPELFNNASVQQGINHKNINLVVNDVRNQHHLLQVVKAGQPATLYNAQEKLDQIILQAFTLGYQRQGYTLNDLSNNQIEITIKKALINADKGMMEYNANTEIEISATVINDNGKLNKDFRITGKNNGPFSPDLAVLSRDFNQQLGKIFNQIMNDAELQQWIK